MRCAPLLLALSACWSGSLPATTEPEPVATVRAPARADAAVVDPAAADLRAVLAELERLHRARNLATALPVFITSDVVVIDTGAQTVQTLSVQQAQQVAASWAAAGSDATCSMSGEPRKLSCVTLPTVLLEYCYVLTTPTTAQYRLVSIAFILPRSGSSMQWLATVPKTPC